MDNPHDKVVILSVPHMEGVGYVAVAPILLSACLNKDNIPAVGLDFASEFRSHFSKFDDYSEITNWMCFGYLGFKSKRNIQIIKFIDRYINNIIVEHNPTYIGLSAFTDQSLTFLELLAGRIRKISPDTKIILGGHGLENINKLTDLPYYESYYHANVADLIIVGDAEFSLVTAIKENKRGLIMSHPQTSKELNEIPIPNWKESIKLVDTANLKYATVTASKGCVRNCTFCDVASYWPKYIFRDGATVATEIATIYNETGIKEFVFTDNLINGSVSNYRKLNNKLLELLPPNTIEYSGYAIFRASSTMPESDFALAAQAGNTQWNVGVETGSQRVRYEMKKNFTNLDLDHSVKMLFKYKIKQRWLMIVGYPSETDSDFEESLSLLRQYAYMAKDNLLSILVTKPFMALDNSPIFDHFTMLQDSSDKWRQHFWVCKENPSNTFEVRATRWHRIYALIAELGIPWGEPALATAWKFELMNMEKFYHEQYKKSDSPLPY